MNCLFKALGARHWLKVKRLKQTLALSLILCLSVPFAWADTVVIGVLAFNGKAQARTDWQPMLSYLQQKRPEHRFELLPLNFSEINEAVEKQQITFLITNPLQYLQLSYEYQLSGVLTLKRHFGSVSFSQMGSVIFRRSENTQLTDLSQTANLRIALVNARSAGGKIFAESEFAQQGVNLSELQKLHYYHTHEGVVFAVLSGLADVGVVRTGVLEQLAIQKQLTLNEVTVLAQKTPLDSGCALECKQTFPFLLSTELYPEWALMAMPNVPINLKDQIAATLLLMPNIEMPGSLGYLSWTTLANYEKVRRLMESLNIPPFVRLIEPLSLKVLWEKHHSESVVGLIMLSLLMIVLGVLQRQNSRLKVVGQAFSDSEKARSSLTKDLKDALIASEFSQKQFKQLTQTALEGIVIMNAKGLIEFANPAAHKLFGYEPGGLFGIDLHRTLVPMENRAKAVEGFARFLTTKTGPVLGTTQEMEALTKKGSKIWVSLSISSFELNQQLYVSAMITNVSEARAIRNELSSAKEQAEKYLAVVNAVIFELDGSFKINMMNEFGAKLVGWPVQAFKKLPFAQLSDQEADQLELNMRLREFELSQDSQLSVRLFWQHKSSGARLELKCDIYKEYDGRGEVIGYVGSAIDVTAVVESQKAMQQTQTYFSTVVEKNQSGIMVINASGVIQFANPAAARLLNRSLELLLGNSFGIPISSAEEKIELDILRPNKTPGKAELTVSKTEWQGEPAFLLMIHDITDLHEAQVRIEKMAYYDALTGLPNRSYFDMQLAQIHARAKRNKTPFAIMFLDLNKFKNVNDTLGHHVGDELLIQTAQRIQNQVRASDVLARMGGDEFTLIVEGVNTDTELLALAQKIVDCFAPTFVLSKHELHITPSIGVARYPEDATDTGLLLSLADTAMYQAKKMPMNHIALYQPQMGVQTLQAFTLDSEVYSAFEKQDFEVYYQPQMAIESHEVIGYEALLRWNYDGALRSPDQFVPALESSGLIIKVGFWVIESALAQLKTWQIQGKPLTRISVNVSPIQLLDTHFVDNLANLLKTSDVDFHYLGIEITESAFMNNLKSIQNSVERMQSLGLEVHMDDFGTGHSSLALLKNLPFDVVKLDISFIRNIDSDQRDYNLVKAVISALHAMDIRVIAEGVESQAQLDKLVECCCDEIQGYIVAKPMSVAQLNHFTNPLALS